MIRPPLDPRRFKPFGGKVRLRRVPIDKPGILYQNVNPQVGLPLWVRYNIPGKYWEYSIDNVNFFRLQENPYVPDNVYFKNRGIGKPFPLPTPGNLQLYNKNVSGVSKFCIQWDDGT